MFINFWGRIVPSTVLSFVVKYFIQLCQSWGLRWIEKENFIKANLKYEIQHLCFRIVLWNIYIWVFGQGQTQNTGQCNVSSIVCPLGLSDSVAFFWTGCCMPCLGDISEGGWGCPTSLPALQAGLLSDRWRRGTMVEDLEDLNTCWKRTLAWGSSTLDHRDLENGERFGTGFGGPDD